MSDSHRQGSGGTLRLCLVAPLVATGVAASPLAASHISPGDTLPTVPGYEAASAGTRWLEGAGGLRIKMLVEASNLGGDEVEVGEITFPGNTGREPSPHRHGSLEIFYVLSGVLGHTVNGVAHRVEPGMVAIVRPGDSVQHRVLSDGPVRALVIWAPGGEAERLSRFLQERPVETDVSSDTASSR